MDNSDNQKLYAASIRCERFLACIHFIVMGVTRMNWLLEHTQAATIIAIVGYIIFMGVIMAILASGITIEAGDLQGAPETLGDFPPLPPQLSKEFQNVSMTTIDIGRTRESQIFRDEIIDESLNQLEAITKGKEDK